MCVAWRPAAGSRLLASGGGDHQVVLWDVTTTVREPVHTFSGHTDVWGVAFREDGLLASGADDWTIRLWSMYDLAPLLCAGGGDRAVGVRSVAFGAQQQQLLASGHAEANER